MKEYDEFELNKMLEGLPELETNIRFDERFSETMPSKSFYRLSISKSRFLALLIVGMVLVFIMGFGLATLIYKQHTSPLVKSELEFARNLLVQNMAKADSPNQRLASIEYISSTGSDRQIVEDLLYLLELEPNENVRLALIQTLNTYTHLPLVEQRLISYLPQEENPFVTITIINVIAAAKTKEGFKILKDLQDIDSLHPMIKNHLTKIEL
ncbi:MAG: hypothetical protein AAFO07_04980 [Bacteroidota bacterium]